MSGRCHRGLVSRSADTPSVPIGVRCKICRLDCDDGSLCIEVHFGPKGKYDDNPLAALDRDVWICEDCADVIARVR